MEKYLGIASLAVLAVTVLVSAYTDARMRKIFDLVTLPAAFIGLSLSYLAGGLNDPGTKMNLFNSLCGLAAGMGIFLLPHLLGWFARGDVTLMAAVGALVGWPYVLVTTVYIVLCGAAMAIVWSIWLGKFGEMLRSIPKSAVKIKAPQAVEGQSAPLTIP